MRTSVFVCLLVVVVLWLGQGLDDGGGERVVGCRGSGGLRLVRNGIISEIGPVTPQRTALYRCGLSVIHPSNGGRSRVYRKRTLL